MRKIETETSRRRGMQAAGIAFAAGLVIGIGALLLLTAGCGPAPAEDLTGDVEDALEDFYEAAAEGDLDDLQDLIGGDLADEIAEREENETLEQFWALYRGAEAEVDEIEVDGDEAEATVILTAGGRQFEQEAELELEDDEWLVLELGDLEPYAGEDEREAEERPAEHEESSETRISGLLPGGGAAEQQARGTAERFLAAVRRTDLDQVEGLLTGTALTEFREWRQRVQENPEEFENFRQESSQTSFSIVSVTVDEQGQSMTVHFRARNADGNEWEQAMVLQPTDGEWRIADMGAVSTPEPGEAEGDCSDAQQISLGQAVGGNASGTAVEYYRFTISRAATYVVSTSGSVDTVGTLLDSNCRQLANDDDSGDNANFRIQWSLAPGTYYVSVRGYSSRAAGQYMLTVEELSGESAAGGGGCAGARQTLAANREVSGNLGGTSQEIYYRVEIARAGTYCFETSGQLDVVGRLFDGNCNELALNDDGGEGFNFRIEQYLQPGTYYVAVRAYSSSASGAFTLSFSEI